MRFFGHRLHAVWDLVGEWFENVIEDGVGEEVKVDEAVARGRGMQILPICVEYRRVDGVKWKIKGDLKWWNPVEIASHVAG